MPAKRKNTVDVFISCALEDAGIAEDVASTMRAHDLTTFFAAQDLQALHSEKQVWDAIAECRAFVVILSVASPGSRIAFEFGAARAWNKPIYGLSTLSGTSLSHLLAEVRIMPIARAEEVAKSIRASLMPISDDEQQILVEAFRKTAVTVDQLAVSPRKLDGLVKDFNKQTRKSLSGEQVMSTLLRLRKRGLLRPVKKRKD